MRIKKDLCALGKAINHFMVAESVSWYRLSMLSGVSEGSLSKIKYDKASPTLYTMGRIAKALDVKVSDIILKAEELEK